MLRPRQETITSLVEKTSRIHLTSIMYDRREGILYFQRMKIGF